MDIRELRSQSDAALFDQLLSEPEVRRVNEHISRQTEKGNLGVRRHLLSTSVRLSRSMAAELHKTADQCCEMLSLDMPLELYVFPSAAYNAACVKPEAGRLFIMFSSALLEKFTQPEVMFVMGHELGHHLFAHHDIPVGWILRGAQRPDPRLALTLTSWSRYAEVSADRAGAYCTQDLTSVAHALFKLASGLSGSYANFSLSEFLAQVDEMQLEDGQPGQGAPAEDWFLTHPFSPLRVKALTLFHQSQLMTDDGDSRAKLEIGVERLMSLMEPSYLEGKTDTAESMRRLLFAAAIAVADVSQGISDEEVKVFEKFFGKSSFSDKLDISKLKAEVPERVAQINSAAALPQRMQVMRDLCIVAGVDGEVSDAEATILHGLAKDMEIPSLFVDQCLRTEHELD